MIQAAAGAADANGVVEEAVDLVLVVEKGEDAAAGVFRVKEADAAVVPAAGEEVAADVNGAAKEAADMIRAAEGGEKALEVVWLVLPLYVL
jgi:hypothetical protein